MRTSEIYRGIKRPFVVEDIGIKLNASSKDIIERKIRESEPETIEEFLLLRRIPHDTIYQDLASSQIFTEKELDLGSLVPFNRIFDYKENISKYKALKLYNKKMLEKIPVKNLVLGNIGYVSKLLRNDSNYEVRLKLTCSPIKRHALLLKDYDNYVDLETYIKYPYDNYKLGSLIITGEEPIHSLLAEEYMTEDSIEYYKVLSKYRKKFNSRKR